MLTVSKSGIQFPAIRDRKCDFSPAPEKDQVCTGMWAHHLLGPGRSLCLAVNKSVQKQLPGLRRDRAEHRGNWAELVLSWECVSWGWNPSFPVLRYGKWIFSQPCTCTRLRKVPGQNFQYLKMCWKSTKERTTPSFPLPDADGISEPACLSAFTCLGHHILWQVACLLVPALGLVQARALRPASSQAVSTASSWISLGQADCHWKWQRLYMMQRGFLTCVWWGKLAKVNTQARQP